jgi:hypothetical protein
MIYVATLVGLVVVIGIDPGPSKILINQVYYIFFGYILYRKIETKYAAHCSSVTPGLAA